MQTKGERGSVRHRATASTFSNFVKEEKEKKRFLFSVLCAFVYKQITQNDEEQTEHFFFSVRISPNDPVLFLNFISTFLKEKNVTTNFKKKVADRGTCAP